MSMVVLKQAACLMVLHGSLPSGQQASAEQLTTNN
jgi:hypothetical protein